MGFRLSLSWLLLLVPSLVFAQPVSVSSSVAKKLRYTTTLPATCAAGEIHADSDATSGRRVYVCESANTWVLQGDGGGGGNSFETIAIPAGTNPVADSSTDTLTITETSFLTITGTAGTDTIDITQVTTDIGTDGLIAANSVALTTDTTGNYAAGDAEAGAALTGDTATSFFSIGTLEVAIGGTGTTTSTGTGAVVLGTSPTITTPIETGKIDRNNVAVDDDDCTSEQGLYWYDTTDSRFEVCDANSGIPEEVGTRYIMEGPESSSRTATFWVEPGGIGSTTEANSDDYIAPENCTASQMYVGLQTAPGAGNSWTICANVNGTVLTEPCCTISNTALTCSETVSTGTIVGGQIFNWEFAATGAVTGSGNANVVMICTP